ncbi:MAG: hypothetical protein L0Y72_11170 [Gemmataceae bacterium]|nr:hypothetical protein [Gemmataceae bacterium]MCI0739597.1 hypothetical protein [Gemmataceae bacterium]
MNQLINQHTNRLAAVLPSANMARRLERDTFAMLREIAQVLHWTRKVCAEITSAIPRK